MLCPLFSMPLKEFRLDNLNHLGTQNLWLHGFERKMDLI